MRNNTASGVFDHAFDMPAGIFCDRSDPNIDISYNIAHSSGIGIFAGFEKGTKGCLEISSFIAYKNKIGIPLSGSDETRVHDNIAIDNLFGINANARNRVEVRDNCIYGTKNMPSKDCPTSIDGKCECEDRLGVVTPSWANSWEFDSLFINNRFIGFDFW